MGAIGFIVKLIHIPVNNILVYVFLSKLRECITEMLTILAAALLE